mmetsp:Transcript_87330/g.232732  ORF Transcript_87330/g.232732 Transcript_87330/m.232732 type:complete len:278 (-) Transcript_87330:62-895(-)
MVKPKASRNPKLPQKPESEDDEAEDEEFSDEGSNEDDFEDSSDQDNSDEDDESDEDESESEDEKERLRASLSDIPFEVLQEMRKDGTVRNQQEKKESLDKPRRKSKHAPLEMSSKRPVSRYREVVAMPTKRNVDPRFERTSGKLNEELFRKSFAFVAQKRQEEMKELKQRMSKIKDPTAREELAAELDALQRVQQREAAVEARRERETERKRTERKLVREGKKPFFLKKSDQRNLELAKRFEDLSKKGKVDDVVAKRRRKNAQKDHRYMPYQRRDGQ